MKKINNIERKADFVIWCRYVAVTKRTTAMKHANELQYQQNAFMNLCTCAVRTSVRNI